MTISFEELTVHGACHFIDAIAEQEAPFINGEFGLSSGQEVTVEIHHAGHAVVPSIDVRRHAAAESGSLRMAGK
jgi:hypothetical protein